MKKEQFNRAYVLALRAYSQTLTRSKTQKGSHIVAGASGVSQVPTGQMETYSPEEITICASKLPTSLSRRELQLFTLIVAELKYNNALWHFDHTKNTRDAMAIKGLREKGVIHATEDPRIHFVNPDFIRRGNKLLVSANTAMVTATGKVCLEMIRPLNKKNIELNPLHLTELT